MKQGPKKEKKKKDEKKSNREGKKRCTSRENDKDR